MNFQNLAFIHDKIILYLKPAAINFFNTNLILGHPVSLMSISLVRIQIPFKAKNTITSSFSTKGKVEVQISGHTIKPGTPEYGTMEQETTAEQRNSGKQEEHKNIDGTLKRRRINGTLAE